MLRGFAGRLPAWLWCAACLVPACAAAASTQDQGTQAATNMAAIYQRICLDAFPDPRAVGVALDASHAMRLPANETGDLLNGAPGSAWRLSTATADYTLTIADAPYNACALLRMTAWGLPTALPYIAAVQAYARRHALLMGVVAPLDQEMAGGAAEHVLATKLTPKSGKGPQETSMYIMTDFKGHYTGWAAGDAAGGTGVQVKMEHHIEADR